MFQILKTSFEVSYGQQHDRKAIESKKECVTKKVEEGGQAFFQANYVKLTELPHNFEQGASFRRLRKWTI